MNEVQDRKTELTNNVISNSTLGSPIPHKNENGPHASINTVENSILGSGPVTNESKENVEENQENHVNKQNEEQTETSREPQKEEWLDILGSGGIMKKTLIEGKTDSQPKRNEKCVINYTCSLEDGTEVDRGSNFELYVGEFDVISGLDISLALVNVGERCLLKIEPRLAFGVKGLPPTIPPNALVQYDVELLSVLPEDEMDTLTIPQRKTIGNKKRERGNWWYSRNENNIAIQCYRRALDYLDEVESSTILEDNNMQVSDSDLQALLEDRIHVCNNMAAAQIKMQMYDAALNSLQTVLKCQPNNLKAHFRKAKAYNGKNDLNMAMKSLQRAKALAPGDLEIQKEINNVSRIMEKQKATERELARRMFNGPNVKNNKTSVKSQLKKQGKSKILLLATVGGVVAVGLAGLMAHRMKYA